MKKGVVSMFDSRVYFKSENDPIMEEYNQTVSIITEISKEAKELARDETTPKKNLFSFFAQASQFILKLQNLEMQLSPSYFKKKDFHKLIELNDDLFSELYTENYSYSYANPTYCVKILGENLGQLISYFYTQIRSNINYVFNHQIYKLYELNQVFIMSYNYVRDHPISYNNLKKIILAPRFDENSRERYYSYKLSHDTNYKQFTDIIEQADLNDLRYLFRLGHYISNNEIRLAQFMNRYPIEKIKALASIIVKAYFRSFEESNKNISIKKTVGFFYKIGLERLYRQVFLEFRKRNLESTVLNVYSTSPNKQYQYDHKFDRALYLNEEFSKLELQRVIEGLRQNKDILDGYSGAVVFAKFGEKPFTPQNKSDNLKLDDIQKEKLRSLNNDLLKIRSKYLRPSETSFCMIAFPIPEIGDDFEEIFAATVDINSLDSEKYERIQQSIIDVLDQAELIHLQGKNGNLTNLQIKLNKLTNPKEETNFVNSGASSNIPVGEVFTSPSLTETEGLLHIDESYHGSIRFENLKLEFIDGYISNYSCTNFEDEEDNKKFIEDHLLFPHKTLPMGEFAIGTNTLAYVISKKFNILNVMTMLILEKTGPHIAIGDTCFARREELKIFNKFNKKEVIAKDNEKSILRNSNLHEAYTNVHRDITIPFESINFLKAITRENGMINIIKNGRFVLEGTQDLNIPLIKYKLTDN